MKHALWVGWVAWASTGVFAQALWAEPETIRLQRQEIALQRDAVMASYQQNMTACWQKFAVNDCLRQARQLRRSALEPLHQQDLRLNEQERLWRAEQRTQRLESKQPENRATP